jgi:hypothetical protein
MENFPLAFEISHFAVFPKYYAECPSQKIGFFLEQVYVSVFVLNVET